MSWIGSVPFTDLGMTQGKLDLMNELAEENDYWMRACAFVRATTHRKLSSLSDFQRRWLTTIILDLDYELEKRSWSHS